MYQIYQVNEGDTLNSIANNLGITIEELAMINGLSNNSNLTVGSSIIIPKITQPLFDFYVIKAGDNIYDIARKNNVDYEELLKINGLEKDEYIYPGQEIIIPKPYIDIYVTKEGDTLNTISTFFNTTPSAILANNPIIYLVPDQLIIHVKENQN